MKGTQNEESIYPGHKLSHTYPIYVIRKENSKSICFHARLIHMALHISATMLAITLTESWLGDGSAEVDQSLGLQGRQI
jgi:hypothetical protein